MTITKKNREKLPLEYPVREALRIYMRRLFIFVMVIATNLAFLGVILSILKFLTLPYSTAITLLIAIQGICVVILTLLGLLPHTYDRTARKLTTLGWSLLIVASAVFVSVTTGREIVTLRSNERLLQRTEEIRNILHGKTGDEIMEGQVPICQVISPFPPKPPWEKVERLEIRLPAEGSKVSGQFYVEGLVPDPESDVFVIFHSIASPDFQVQPKVTVCEDNIWRVRISMEKTVGIDVGSVFEIMAVANPTVELKEGDILAGWPEAQWRSQVVEVIRK